MIDRYFRYTSSVIEGALFSVQDRIKSQIASTSRISVLIGLTVAGCATP